MKIYLIHPGENDGERLTDNGLLQLNLLIYDVVKDGKDTAISLGDGIHRAIISRLTGMPLHSTRHFSLWPGSISVLQYEGAGNTGLWRMTRVNDTNHLRV